MLEGHQDHRIYYAQETFSCFLVDHDCVMMSTEGLLYATLSLRRAGGPTPWELCVALLPTLRHHTIVAVTPPGSYVTQQLKACVERDALFLHTPAELPDSQSDVVFVLGEHDRDRLPVSDRFWLPTPARPMQRVRQLDRLYAPDHAVGLIVLDCPSSGPSVLAGAGSVIREHRPVVLLDFSSIDIADRVGTWERCEAILGPHYKWYDGMLLPCADAARRSEAVQVCATRVACALPLEHAAVLGRLPHGLEIPPSLTSIAALAWQGWQHSVPDDDRRRTGTAVPFDTELPSRNLHPAETDGGTWWRWTGPGPRSHFAMPIPGPGRWLVGFEIINPGNVLQASDIQVYAGDRRLQLQSFGTSRMTFGPLTVDTIEASNVIKLQVVTPPTRRASEYDPRRIGISISRCLLEPA